LGQSAFERQRGIGAEDGNINCEDRVQMGIEDFARQANACWDRLVEYRPNQVGLR
jgi:hypothetical protein